NASFKKPPHALATVRAAGKARKRVRNRPGGDLRGRSGWRLKGGSERAEAGQAGREGDFAGAREAPPRRVRALRLRGGRAQLRAPGGDRVAAVQGDQGLEDRDAARGRAERRVVVGVSRPGARSADARRR